VDIGSSRHENGAVSSQLLLRLVLCEVEWTLRMFEQFAVFAATMTRGFVLRETYLAENM